MSLRLISVRFSHYCEKARWALDRAGLAYTEDAHVPVLSWRATFGARGGRTVPVLVTPDGVLEDSTEILRWIDRQGRGPALFPAGPVGEDVAALEDEADRRVGPATRRLAYHALFTDPDATRALVLSAGPGWERRAGRAVYPLLRQMIRRGLKVDDAGAARSRVTLDEAFAKVALRLADGRPYLAGDTFTAADLTFIALATPVLLPPEYVARYLPSDAPIPATRAIAERYRETPAGRWALSVYARERSVTH